MPKKYNKRKNKSNNTTEQRALILKEDMEDYAMVIKPLGNRRLTVIMTDTTEVIAVIPGRFKKRCWMNIGDIVLVSYREFENNKKVDIIHKYEQRETRKLLKMQEIPPFFMDSSLSTNNTDDIGYIIQNSDDDEPETFDFNDI